MPDASLALTVIVVVTAVGFDFTNGFHDTANAMATTIVTGALQPRVAVGVAAIRTSPARSSRSASRRRSRRASSTRASVTLEVVFAGLVGAILWNR